jgi:cytoskeletal protein CcmA (bactofilin family)
MRKYSKGNLLLTFIMVVALSITIFAYLAFIGVRLRESGIKVSDIESFYAAEAGLNKAIWYLGTPAGQGGKGFSWRATSSWEAFGWGGYLLTVRDYATNEVQIISTGEVSGILKTVSQVVSMGGVPSAFDYAVYCNTGASFTGNVTVQGDVYTNGSTTFGNNCSFTEGYVCHPSGTTLSGGGTWTDGGSPNPEPPFPVFDPSYYDNLITAAQSVPAGNQSYSNTTVNLGGSTIYVNGDVSISGNVTFNGPGTVVATGKIDQSGNTYSSSSVKFISYGAVKVTGNTYTSGATYYSATEVEASGNTRVEAGSFLTKGPVKLSGNLNLSGMIYAESGASFISGNPVVRGSFVANSFSTFSGNANVYYDESKFPSTLPDGFTPSTLTVKKGTWKGS